MVPTHIRHKSTGVAGNITGSIMWFWKKDKPKDKSWVQHFSERSKQLTSLEKRAKKTLAALKQKEQMLQTYSTKQESELDKLREELSKSEAYYKEALEEAQETIRKYSSEVDSLRDVIRVNEKTIEAMDASMNHMREMWRADTAVQVMKKHGAESRTNEQ